MIQTYEFRNLKQEYHEPLFTKSFLEALKTFFEELGVPVDYVSDAPATVETILEEKLSRIQ